jgi:DNA-directed RNA polymerase subunit L
LKDPETEEANCFQFEIESIGILSANKILHTAYDILQKQLQTIQQLTVQINDSLPGEDQLFLFSIPSLEEMYAVDIQMNTFCHTMGNLLQTYFYEQLIRPTPNGQLLYVGYKKPHPLDNHIILRIVLRQAVDEKWDHSLYFQTVQQLVKQQCQELSNYLTMTLQQLAI